MNYLKRAWCYITRRITKSILLAITFFVIGNFVILGLGISQAADNAKTLTRKSMKAVVDYEVDYNAYNDYVNTLTDQDEINEAWSKMPTISNDTAMTLAKDSRVTAYNYMLTTTAYSDGFDNVLVGNEDSNQNNGTYIDENGVEQAWVNPNIMVKANAFPNMIEMTDGTFSIASGRFYTQDDLDNNKMVCLITQELADMNNLKVGDSISLKIADGSTITSMVAQGYSADIFKMNLEIIGIYTTTQEVDPSSDNYKWMSPYESPKNVVLMPSSAYKEFMTVYMTDMMKYYADSYGQSTEDTEGLIERSLTPSKVTYLLDDPLHVDQFVSDYKSTVAEYTQLNANNDAFNKMARPLDTLSFFANIIVAIVVVNAVIIISLVTALTLKTREFEIGVLLSLGVSKFKIVLQLFMELFIISLLGFTLAVGSGSLLAGKVGDTVLEYQVASDSQYKDDTSDNNYYYYDSSSYFTEVTQEDLLSQYHVSVSGMLIAEIYVLGTLVVLIATIIPSVMIMRLNPKQILLATN